MWHKTTKKLSKKCEKQLFRLPSQTPSQVEAIVVPLLDRDVLDSLDPDEVAAEQGRQRIKMQVRGDTDG